MYYNKILAVSICCFCQSEANINLAHCFATKRSKMHQTTIQCNDFKNIAPCIEGHQKSKEHINYWENRTVISCLSKSKANCNNIYNIKISSNLNRKC
jgi:hypothetical protein